MSQSNIRKAAVLLASLPREQADALVARLDRQQARAVLAEITKGESVTSDEQELVLLEFAASDGTKSRQARGDQSAVAALEQGPLRFLCDVEPRAAARLLADERPQTIALVASRLPSAYSAQMIAAMPPGVQLAVIRAVAALEPTAADVVDDVAQVLEARVSKFAA